MGLTSVLRDALDKRVEWTISLVDDRLGRRRETLHDRLDDLERFGRGALQAQGWMDGDGRLGEPVAQLRDTNAAYLTWAAGPQGYAAQAGLWFNPPVPVNLVPGGVEVLMVNERVIEQPWVFAQVGADRPLRILDVGGSESTVAVSLATLGHAVTVVDPRGYPVAHPNLTVAACRLEDYDGPAAFDVAVCLSAVEHFGLDHYGQEASAARADHAALRTLRGLVRADGGRLLLTVPYGPAFAVAGFERIYDRPALDELLDGWTVAERRVAQWRDRLAWELLAPDAEPTGRAVALVAATA